MKILAVAGASGGHIFPALAFIDASREKYAGADVLLVLPKKNALSLEQVSRYKVRYVSVCAVGRKASLKNLGNVFNLLKGFAQSLFILAEFRPEVVVGFGSIASVPVVFWAWFFRIKTLVHEQNVIPGQANRMLSWFSDRIAISFEESRSYLAGQSEKVVFTGNPVRKELAAMDRNEAREFFGFAPEKFTLLVAGGSQGSHRINQAILRALAAIPQYDRLQVIHLSGAADKSFLENGYRDLQMQIKARVFDFFTEMRYAYNACDLVISRSGATTLAELASFRLPAILIPYPYALGHQMANALALKEKGRAVIIRDDQLESDALALALGKFIANPDLLREMRENYRADLQSSPAGLLVEAAVGEA